MFEAVRLEDRFFAAKYASPDLPQFLMYERRPWDQIRYILMTCKVAALFEISWTSFEHLVTNQIQSLSRISSDGLSSPQS